MIYKPQFNLNFFCEGRILVEKIVKGRLMKSTFAASRYRKIFVWSSTFFVSSTSILYNFSIAIFISVYNQMLCLWFLELSHHERRWKFTQRTMWENLCWWLDTVSWSWRQKIMYVRNFLLVLFTWLYRHGFYYMITV